MVDTGLYIGPDNAPDRYRLLRSIGRGGEAVLYLAELELGGATEPVVVKMLDARQTLSQELFSKVSEKWREQAELLRFVHRLGVVGIREHFEGASAHPGGAAPDAEAAAGRALYLVMNHVEGLDLRDWRAERALERPAERREAVRCLEQLADVLDWLHSGAATPSGRTVVHGDLSPGNVMIDANGQATLVDFGLSKLTADHRTAEVWFTPGFAAPEVFEGKRTPATDRYAFGAIAYFLLSGVSPGTMPETLRAALLDLPELAPLDLEHAARIAAIFANDPADRPESLAAWVRELRPAVISTTSRPPVPAAGPDPVPAPSTPPPAPSTPPPPVHAPGIAPTTADPVGAAVPPAPRTPPVPAHTPPPPYAPPAPEVVRESVPETPPAAKPPAVLDAPAHRPPPSPARFQAPEPEPEPEPEPGPGLDPRPTVVLDPAGGGGRRRSRKPQVITAFVVALLLVGGGAYAGIALSGRGGGNDDATAGGRHSSSSPSPDRTTPPSADQREPAGPGPTDTPTVADTMSPGDTEALTVETPADSDDSWETGTAEVNGKKYYDVLRTGSCYDGDGYAEYNLGRRWSAFRAVLGVDDNGKDAPVLITITADGNQLFRKQVLLGQPMPADLDISGALRLRIEWAVDSDLECGTGVMAEPTLVR